MNPTCVAARGLRRCQKLLQGTSSVPRKRDLPHRHPAPSVWSPNQPLRTNVPRSKAHRLELLLHRLRLLHGGRRTSELTAEGIGQVHQSYPPATRTPSTHGITFMLVVTVCWQQYPCTWCSVVHYPINKPPTSLAQAVDILVHHIAKEAFKTNTEPHK